jgi:hypothetical protein
MLTRSYLVTVSRVLTVGSPRVFDPRRSRLEHPEAVSGIIILPPGVELPDWWRREPRLQRT